MTIASQTSRITYTGDGVTTAFAIPFYFQTNADIVGYLQDTSGNATLQVLGTNYNLTGATLSAGGTCTFVTAPTSGYLISIYRDPPMTQTASYNNNDPFPAKSHELALDKTATIDQRTRDLVSRSLHLTDGEASTTTTLASVATRKNKLLGFDTNGAIIYSTGPTFVNSTATASAIIDSRATASVTTFPISVSTLRTNGYTTAGDGGEGVYTRGSGTSPGAFQDGSSVWWNLVTNGVVNLKALGAGQGSGTADVAAMTTAISVPGPVVGGVTTGPAIIMPASNYDFSTGAFLFTKNGTRILGQGMRDTVITFNPAGAATLFTFYNAGDLTGGISNCEVSNLEIRSTNTVQKTLFAIKNASVMLLDKILTQGITDAGGASIGISNMGRNWFTVRDSFIYADNPHYMTRNPDRANYGNQDIDYMTFERCQMVPLKTTSAVHTVNDGVNVTNWSDTDSDWAQGRYGVFNVDSTSDLTSYTWRFKGIRREQEQGGNPTMFAILRSGLLLRDVIVEGCSTNTQLFNLTGIDRVNFEDVTVFGNAINIGSADSTVSRLKWRNLFAQSANTIALTGQTLVRGREKMGGSNILPIYTDATYTNTAEGTIEWIGAPSVTNNRRVGLWRGCADVPVSTGINDFALVPWGLYTILYAEIRVTSPTVSGVAIFRSGQVAPGGCSSLVGLANFAVDGGAGHLSVYHYSDVNVSIVNKLAGAAPVSVEVLFTI